MVGCVLGRLAGAVVGEERVGQGQRQVIDRQSAQVEVRPQEAGQPLQTGDILLGGHAGRQRLHKLLVLAREEQRLRPVDAAQQRPEALDLLGVVGVGVIVWPCFAQLRQAAVGRLQRARVQRVGQHGQDGVEGGGHLALPAAAAQQVVVVGVQRVEGAGDGVAGLMGGHEDG